MTWDAEDRLTGIGSTWTAGYRGDSLRAWKSNAGTKTYFLYDGGTPVVEMDGSGNVTAVNTFGAAGLLARKTSVGPSFYTFDLQGNVAQRFGFSGGVQASFNFDAFGVGHVTTAADPFGYGAQAGYYTDLETGLQAMSYRYYDPGAGRWLNRDPAGYGGGINLYGYCANGPVDGSDPTGLDEESGAEQGIENGIGWAGAVFGAAGGFIGGATLGGGLGGAPAVVLAPAGAVAGAASGYVVGRIAGTALVKLGRAVGDLAALASGSRELGTNLKNAGNPRPSGHAAHHIVPENDPRGAAARRILQRFGIGINDADNGVFLPNTRAASQASSAAYHRTLHTNRYYNEVTRLLRQAARTGCKDKVEQALTDIANRLANGTFPH